MALRRAESWSAFVAGLAFRFDMSAWEKRLAICCASVPKILWMRYVRKDFFTTEPPRRNRSGMSIFLEILSAVLAIWIVWWLVRRMVQPGTAAAPVDDRCASLATPPSSG